AAGAWGSYSRRSRMCANSPTTISRYLGWLPPCMTLEPPTPAASLPMWESATDFGFSNLRSHGPSGLPKAPNSADRSCSTRRRRPGPRRTGPWPSRSSTPSGACEMDEDTELTHAKARRDRSADPLGKRALFSVPSDSDPGVGAQGRRAVFSGGDRAPEVGIDLNAGVGPRSGRRFTVRCQRCRQVSRVSLVDLLIFQFPI